MSFEKDAHHYVKLRARLMRRARRLARNRDEAEDLVQETLLRMYRRDLRGTSIEKPTAYAMRVLAHLAQRGWSGPVPEELDIEHVAAPEQTEARLECLEVLAAIDRLPTQQRLIMAFVIAGEASPRIIARELGLPLGTVMSRLARARARLRIDVHRQSPD